MDLKSIIAKLGEYNKFSDKHFDMKSIVPAIESYAVDKENVLKLGIR